MGGAPRSDTAPTLAERAAAGDPGAFTELISRYDARLRALAYSLLGADAAAMDDVLQEAYLKAYVGLRNYRREADLGTWLYRVVYNACIDELRRRGRRPQPVGTDDRRFDRPVERSGPEAQASAADAATRILRELPDEQRLALVLVDVEGFDTETAARVLGVAHGTVRSRLSRARAKARQILEERP